jgi:nucleoside-diphosphate-sugar epimerase
MLPRRFEHKVLLTGASGFLGGRLRDALLDAGADVIALRRPRSPEAGRGRSAVAEYADTAALGKLIADEKPDYVFHAAGATKGVRYDDFERANVMPTQNLLRALEEHHPEVKRYVLVSSLAAYGPSAPDRPHSEAMRPRPIEHYGESKLAAERALAEQARKVAWTVIRPGGIYGPGDVDYFNLFREVSKGRNVYFGNRERWFSAVYVDDCVRAIVAAAESPAAVGRGYFICDGVPVTWGEFQEAIVAASGRRVRTLELPEFLVDVAAFGGELATRFDGKPRLFNRQKAKMGAQAAWTCQHDAARDDFGYRPEVPMREGVRLSFAWYRDNGWL